jgi:hypothetical protein
MLPAGGLKCVPVFAMPMTCKVSLPDPPGKNRNAVLSSAHQHISTVTGNWGSDAQVGIAHAAGPLPVATHSALPGDAATKNELQRSSSRRRWGRSRNKIILTISLHPFRSAGDRIGKGPQIPDRLYTFLPDTPIPWTVFQGDVLMMVSLTPVRPYRGGGCGFSIRHASGSLTFVNRNQLPVASRVGTACRAPRCRGTATPHSCRMLDAIILDTTT